MLCTCVNNLKKIITLEIQNRFVNKLSIKFFNLCIADVFIREAFAVNICHAELGSSGIVLKKKIKQLFIMINSNPIQFK